MRIAEEEVEKKMHLSKTAHGCQNKSARAQRHCFNYISSKGRRMGRASVSSPLLLKIKLWSIKCLLGAHPTFGKIRLDFLELDAFLAKI